MIYNFYDWDDTIVYTRKSQFMAYRDAIKHYTSYKITWEIYNEKFYGRSNTFLAILGCSNTIIEKIKKLKTDLYLHKYLDSIEFIINKFPSDEENFIISNTSTYIIEKILKDNNINSKFSHIIGSDSFNGASRKPSTDLYHFAFSKIKSFNYNLDVIKIYEDSYEGLMSAVNFSQENKIINIFIQYNPHPSTRNWNELSTSFYPSLRNGL
jgi:FMN phosphatase YigB (HAD superfamily)